jgi:hypothetical protein
MNTSQRPSFRFINQYDTINRRLHKAHPPLVGTPAVVRQIGFWMPWLEAESVAEFRGLSRDAEVTTEDRRGQWVAHADAYIASLFRCVHRAWSDEVEAGRAAPEAEPIFPNLPNQDSSVELFAHKVSVAALKSGSLNDEIMLEAVRFGFSRRNEHVTFTFYHDGVPITVRAGLQDEYFSLTLVVQLSSRIAPAGQDAADPPAGSFAAEAKGHLESLEALVSKRWSKIETTLRHREGDFARGLNVDTHDMHDDAHFFYNTIWEQLDEAYLLPGLTADFRFASRETALQMEPDRLGHIFCDLRNCAFSIGVDEGPREGIADPRSPNCDPLGKHLPISKPNIFLNAPRKALAAYTTERIFNDRDSLSVVDTFLPFLEAAALSETEFNTLQKRIGSGGGDVGDPIHKLEYAATRFLHGRAIHLSTLLGDAKQDEQRPLKFLMIFRSRHRWQVGRVIERINYLGTMRLASLLRLSRFTEVGRKLRDFRLGTNHHIGNTGGADAYRAEYDRYSAAFQTRMPRLGSPPRENAPSEGGASDGEAIPALREGENEVIFGLERTRYYICQFNAMVDDLRAWPIEGFQPYAEFVRRRLGANWAFIETLADRIERIDRQLERIRAQSNYAQFGELTRHNASQNTRTATLMGLADVAAGIAGTVTLAQILKGAAASFPALVGGRLTQESSTIITAEPGGGDMSLRQLATTGYHGAVDGLELLLRWLMAAVEPDRMSPAPVDYIVGGVVYLTLRWAVLGVYRWWDDRRNKRSIGDGEEEAREAAPLQNRTLPRDGTR